MSKKKFSSGLDDLFAELEAHSVGDGVTDISVRVDSGRKSTGLKNFTSDLEAVLREEGFDTDAVKSHPSGHRNTKSKSAQSSDAIDLPSGLDALIRQTIDIQALEKEEQKGVRRLTVAVDREKLDKLKTIARMENAYLKDLLIELIDEYITEYVQDKGIQL